MRLSLDFSLSLPTTPPLSTFESSLGTCLASCLPLPSRQVDPGPAPHLLAPGSGLAFSPPVPPACTCYSDLLKILLISFSYSLAVWVSPLVILVIPWIPFAGYSRPSWPGLTIPSQIHFSNPNLSLQLVCQTLWAPEVHPSAHVAALSPFELPLPLLPILILGCWAGAPLAGSLL